MNTCHKIKVCAMCAAMAAVPFFAEAVQLDPAEWSRSITVKFTGYAGTTALEGFPALIRLSAGMNGFDYLKCADGSGLRFADSDGNLIPHEVDTWNVGGTSLVWVKVPSLTKTATITCYYGYKGSGAMPAVTASDVWSNGYVGVWHMGAGSDDMTQPDSTANPITLARNRLASSASDGVAAGVSGKVGSAASFRQRSDGKGCYSAVDTDGKLDGFQSLTVEGWTCQRELNADENNHVLIKRAVSGSQHPYRWYGRAGLTLTGIYVYYDLNGTITQKYNIPTNEALAPELNSWCHQAHLYDGATGKMNWYIDGVSGKTGNRDAATLCHSVGGEIVIGNNGDGNGNAFPGMIDEVRISSVARSADWIKASYDAVANDEFATYEFSAEEEECGLTKYTRKFEVSFPGMPEDVTLTDFPVLVKLSASSPSGFSYADVKMEGGADLCFVDENDERLASEVDTWDESATSLVWVKVPVLNSSTKITCYYGWDSAPSTNPRDVWSNGYVGVWHMGAGSDDMTQSDSTANPITLARNRLASSASDGIASGVAGMIGKAASFRQRSDGKGCYSAIDTDGKLDGFKSVTIEGWTCQRGINSADSYVLVKKASSGKNPYTWYARADYTLTGMYVYYDFNGTLKQAYNIPTNESYAPGLNSWCHQVHLYDGVTGEMNWYINGVSGKYASRDQATVSHAAGGEIVIGNNGDGNANAFPGMIDEVRISNVARSQVWIKATHDTVADNAAFTSYGSVTKHVVGIMVFFY